MKEFLPIIERLEKGLQTINMPAEPKNLYTPIQYTLSLGGKRLRPLLVVLAQKIFDEKAEPAIDAALAIEVFHNFTLVHDDIMDEAPIRRGQPSVYKKWNTNVAILSGDVMLVQAYQLLANAPKEILADALQLFNTCAIEVCEGQQYDMDFEERNTVEVQEYIEMIRLKTAVLLGFALEFGALIGGASKQEAELLRNFGQKIGIGFQLKDDLLDVYGDHEKFGKQVGGDIISNKKTFLLIEALKRAEGQQKEQLDYWLKQTSFDAEKKVKAVRGIYDELGIQTLTEQKMNEYFDEAFSLLREINVADALKQPLESFTKQLIERES